MVKRQGPREAVWTANICKGMRNVGAKVHVIAGNLYSDNGLPDRHVVWSRLDDDNNPVCLQAWLEFKTDAGRLRPGQQAVLREMAMRGVCAVVVRQPNLIEDCNGNVVCRFDGTGFGLLRTLWLSYGTLWGPQQQDLAERCRALNTHCNNTPKPGP